MPENASTILTRLREGKARFVRVVWCDNGNVIRGKAIHIDALTRQLEGGEAVAVGLSAAQQAIPVVADAVAPGSGLGPVGEVWLVPAWETLQMLPYAPGQARVMGEMVKDEQPWPWCARQFLKRMVQRASDQGIAIKAAFEPEFYLLRRGDHDSLPADNTPFAATLAMDRHQEVVMAIAAALSAQDIAIEQYYPESGPGQQEISVRYTDALAAADQHVVYRETVKAIAHQQGLIASFVPKVFESHAGSGCHLHLSLWEGEQNLMSDGAGGLSDVASSFTAGLLHHLPALMAITAPSPNSYRRLQPHCWSGAYAVWGMDNREAALRVPSNFSSPSPTHIELKTVDGAANPYLALGGAIAAGLDGMAQGYSLPEPVQCDPGVLSEAERGDRGIALLPQSLAESLAALDRDAVLLDALGEPLAKTYRAVRQAELAAMDGMTLAAEVDLLLERY
ncbi:glutamine synthetase family protein [Leptolyngbya sp. CCNP1308]|uniref:glutamine synthetase family protein n=1 Tax=Leptolyngbya sp. CCNP1308 TaxID=3110255 RepID=UPI002B2182A3|nr:glutamine synthetase family protein [Leptolyngbya sp. CCNP1308]MEA5451345.1 glutamine synthetase family protein [Leptolyngbya sp. CCNP1308]